MLIIRVEISASKASKMNNTFRIILPILSLMLPAISYAKTAKIQRLGTRTMSTVKVKMVMQFGKRKQSLSMGSHFLMASIKTAMIGQAFVRFKVKNTLRDTTIKRIN
ncbi:hypothetical protein D1115_18860 [Vibrio alfacsensis]|uniref:Secreted protein n=1 Tax=Vibrio alfacsensis TaxID=1074311 RepID=A0ABN5PK28_9VIBR|nr:hypothetical protein D1115_18860 [Vibrio alfacsensis]